MRWIRFCIASLFLFHVSFAGPLRVVTTYGYIADIVQKIGKEHVDVIALARGDYNPHVIIPKPSYIAKLRTADLLIINGGQLEIGWLPQIIKQANNASVQSGERGFLDLSHHVHMIDVPQNVSRELGDVHPEGNPHFVLDPDNVPVIAKAIMERLSSLDPDHRSVYEANNREFASQWQKNMKQWEEQLRPLKGVNVVEYHRIFDYFFHRFGFVIVGTIEPLPGIPTTTRHIAEVEDLIRQNSVRFIAQDVYNPQDASQFLSRKLGTKMLILPHDVSAVKEADSIEGLFREIIRRMTNG